MLGKKESRRRLELPQRGEVIPFRREALGLFPRDRRRTTVSVGAVIQMFLPAVLAKLKTGSLKAEDTCVSLLTMCRIFSPSVTSGSWRKTGLEALSLRDSSLSGALPEVCGLSQASFSREGVPCETDVTSELRFTTAW